MEYKYIDQQELRKWWATIKPGLDKIKTRSPENWIIEDVYTDCFNQRSLLFVLIENNHYKGFFILQPMGETLHLWAAYSLENSYEVVENALKYIKNMALSANVKYITFSSHRRGWDRRAASYGFRPKQWICEV
jgi:dTDP-D-glucose 4,6-dehydratase